MPTPQRTRANQPEPERTPTATLEIGLVFETLGGRDRLPGEPHDFELEYEPLETIEALEAAIERCGHRVRRLGSPHALLTSLAACPPGSPPALAAALDIAEGYGSRNREAWAPVLLEMAGIPQIGSDALSLSLSLDKAWCNRWVAAAGVRVAPQCAMECAEDALRGELPAPFPLFVKPRWEGTAKGIGAHSRVADRGELARAVTHIARTYAQPALVEAFVPGAEYTLMVVGTDAPRALPALQRAVDAKSGVGVHALADAERGSARPVLEGTLDSELESELQRIALAAFRALECRDFARVDLRLGSDGRPVFLEINPLPTFAPDGTLAIVAELEGRPYVELLAEVIGLALQRLGIAVAEGVIDGSEPSARAAR